jgi:prepilin-type N-terminal cleavage/methylation domain-containing protein
MMIQNSKFNPKRNQRFLTGQKIYSARSPNNQFGGYRKLLTSYGIQNSANGFTIIETLAVISIFAIIMVAIVSSVQYFYRSNTNAVEQAFAINSARKGIEFMVRDIREAIYSDEGSYPVISINPNTFYFYSDIDRDNSIERVRYFAEGTDIKKGVTDSTGDPPLYVDANENVSVISDSVRNLSQGIPVFTYFDSQGSEITDIASTTDVVFVKVNLIVNINPNRLPNEFTLRSSATLRNLKISL